MVMSRGRGASPVRTPLLIREYLGGVVVFPLDEPGDQVTRGVEGDYISRIHQQVKARIQNIDPLYQYPRSHSFKSLVNGLLRLGLLEKTGRQEDPQDRGAGVVGVGRGFNPRTWVRLTEGSAVRPEWGDPVGFLALIYSNVRPVGGVLPTRAAAPAVRPPRRRAPGAPEQETVNALNTRRVGLISLAQAAQTSTQLQTFQDLADAFSEFLQDVAAVFPARQFPDALEALGLLRSCLTILERVMLAGEAQVLALSNCQASSRLAGQAITTPLSGGEAPTAPARELPEVPSIPLPTRFTTRSLPRLKEHVEDLDTLARDFDWPEERFPALAAEVLRLAESGRSWLEAAQDARGAEEDRDSPRESTLERLETRSGALEEYVEALDGEDIDAAVQALEGIE